MTTLGDVLEFSGRPERIISPQDETFVTVRLNCGGAVKRTIGAGKTPVSFTGYRVKPGQFIYSRIDARNGAFALVPQDLGDAVVSKDFPVFDLDLGRINSSYLMHFFKSGQLQKHIQSQSLGATNRQRISEDRFLSFPIQLPALDEQRRIAAILDHADGLRTRRHQALAHLDTLTQSIFHDMFGDPATWPNRWTIDQIGSLAESVNYGTSSKAGQEGKWPILRMGNISPSGRISTADLKYLDLPSNEVERFSVRPGDILFNRTNSPDLVGKTAVVRTNERFAYAGYLIRLRTNTRANPEFISGYLNSPHGKSTLRGMCKSIIGQANINAKELQSIRIAVPPRDLQDQWESVVTKLEAKRNLLLKSESTADSLFQALQSRAFRGEL
ncbi:restriction endonuclease subunit S [Pseudoclavibacter chungangensis]|uniref:Restriction endonuclease subunit S n=1 Tax=Pseudoclavibacter chungangensis TaxID=587635 RepID=A0A7J5C0Y2_9MICO|nr:restriction endonuclease subunit S [Pseudoclavibacter chungangensis]KAB1662153.1 restriction endonuclease subunit S [Pseudoclavibacter chungangensis]NYJ65336.1 type I restriction enzyme S subunit [Pseudoclavibacter chungangensis]